MAHDLEDRLRSLAEEPAPLDVRTLHRRVVHLRRRRTAGGVAVLAAFVLGLSLYLAGSRDGHSTVRTVSPPTTRSSNTAGGRAGADGTRVALPGTASALATDGTDVYVAGETGSSGTGTYVARLSPTGQVMWRADLVNSSNIGGVSVGLGRVWVFSTDSLAILDPANGHVVTAAVPQQVGDMAFAATWAWAITGDGARLLRLDADGTVRKTTAMPGPASRIVATDARTLWVKDDDGNLVKVDATTGNVAATHPWSGDVYAAAGNGSLWAGEASRVVQLTPDALATGESVAVGTRINVNALAVSPTTDGILVATASGVQRYPAASLHTGNRQPAATVKATDITAVAGAGAVVWYIADGALYRFG